ncbi:MAG: hypothetical protein WAO91_06040 [Candidatus Nitrosotenuis sp.]
MTMKNKPMTFLLSSTLALAILTMGIVPAFAATTTVSPTYANGEATTNGPGCNATKCKASFNGGSAVHYLYSDASDNNSGADGANQAWVRTNHKAGSVTYPPTHTTSYSTVGLAADIDFNGNIIYGTGSLVDHQTGPELYLKSAGNWMKVKSCLFLIEGGDAMSGTFTQKCTYTAAGTNKEFRIGGTQKTSAYSTWLGPDTRADFWNGSYHSDIEQLRICDNGC